MVLSHRLSANFRPARTNLDQRKALLFLRKATFPGYAELKRMQTHRANHLTKATIRV